MVRPHGSGSQPLIKAYLEAYETGSPIKTKSVRKPKLIYCTSQFRLQGLAQLTEDVPDFLERLNVLMTLANEPNVHEEIISWCRNKRVIIIKSMKGASCHAPMELAKATAQHYKSSYCQN